MHNYDGRLAENEIYLWRCELLAESILGKQQIIHTQTQALMLGSIGGSGSEEEKEQTFIQELVDSLYPNGIDFGISIVPSEFTLSPDWLN